MPALTQISDSVAIFPGSAGGKLVMGSCADWFDVQCSPFTIRLPTVGTGFRVIQGVKNNNG